MKPSVSTEPGAVTLDLPEGGVTARGKWLALTAAILGWMFDLILAPLRRPMSNRAL
jgi:hypothetical protein